MGVLTDLSETLNSTKLVKALAEQDIAGALLAIDWSRIANLDITQELLRVMGLAGMATMPTLPVMPEVVGTNKDGSPQYAWNFDVVDPETVRVAKEYAGRLVTEVSDSSRKAINEIVVKGWETGVAPRDQAKQIRQVVGLTSSGAARVEKYRESLFEQGLDAGTIDEEVGKYSRTLIADRAMVIARTETMMAANEGQRQMWNQAIGQGFLDPSEHVRQWIVTPDDRLCEFCEAMDGQLADLGGTYEDGVVGPILHPCCRCCEGLVPRSN